MNYKHLEGKGKSLLLFLICFVMYAVVYMTKNMFTYAMASIVENGIMTKAETGAISAAFWVVYAVFQVVGGFAADKFSPSFLISLGLFGGAVANLIIYCNQSYTVIMITWICNAAIQFGLWPSVFKIISTQIAPEFRDKAVFWITLAGSFGMALSMTFAAIVDFWKDNFLWSFILLSVFLVMWITVYPLLQRKMAVSDVAVELKEQAADETINISFMDMIFTSGLWLIIIIGLMRGIIDSAVKMVTPTMLMESYAELGASISTALSIVVAVFAAFGIFVSRLVQTKITSNEMKAAPLLIAISVPALALCCFIGKIHYAWALAGLTFVTVFVSSASLFTNSTIAKRFVVYGKSGTVAGIVNAALSVSNVVASFVFPAMAESVPWSTITTLWLVLAVLLILLSLLTLSRWTKFINNTSQEQ